MLRRPRRLFWILGKLQERDYRIFEFDLPVSPGTLWRDSVLLESLGYVSAERPKDDSKVLLHATGMPIYKELEEAYVNWKKGGDIE